MMRLFLVVVFAKSLPERSPFSPPRLEKKNSPPESSPKTLRVASRGKKVANRLVLADEMIEDFFKLERVTSIPPSLCYI